MAIRLRRKLSAILSVDAEGYSRLMGEDELATVRALKSHRNLMAVLIADYGGRVVDSAGDNLLAVQDDVSDRILAALAPRLTAGK